MTALLESARSRRRTPSQAELSRAILVESQAEAFPYDLLAFGLTFIVHRDVFSPKHFHGWATFTREFPDVTNQRVLEIGCGTGVTSVYLAAKGAAHVTAVDINPAAVSNTDENAKLNRVANIDVRLGDVFSSIDRKERFETIYWNLPFLYQGPTYEYRSVLERGLFDPGYRFTERYLREARHFLTAGGRVLAGLGDFASLPRFRRLASANGWSCRMLAREASVEGKPVEFQLFELTQAEG